VFASAAISSALASVIYDAGGWSAVATLGAALAGAGVLVWLAEQLRLRRDREQPEGAPGDREAQPQRV
jgi:predicted MFS family arabinose efflux permease